MRGRRSGAVILLALILVEAAGCCACPYGSIDVPPSTKPERLLAFLNENADPETVLCVRELNQVGFAEGRREVSESLRTALRTDLTRALGALGVAATIQGQILTSFAEDASFSTPCFFEVAYSMNVLRLADMARGKHSAYGWRITRLLGWGSIKEVTERDVDVSVILAEKLSQELANKAQPVPPALTAALANARQSGEPVKLGGAELAVDYKKKLSDTFENAVKTIECERMRLVETKEVTIDNQASWRGDIAGDITVRNDAGTLSLGKAQLDVYQSGNGSELSWFRTTTSSSAQRIGSSSSSAPAAPIRLLSFSA